MIAIVGTPGSVHYKYKWFPRFGTVDGETAQEWIDRKWGETMARNPVLGTLPTEIISDAKARRRRMPDGSQCCVF